MQQFRDSCLIKQPAMQQPTVENRLCGVKPLSCSMHLTSRIGVACRWQWRLRQCTTHRPAWRRWGCSRAWCPGPHPAHSSPPASAEGAAPHLADGPPCSGISACCVVHGRQTLTAPEIETIMEWLVTRSPLRRPENAELWEPHHACMSNAHANQAAGVSLAKSLVIVPI